MTDRLGNMAGTTALMYLSGNFHKYYLLQSWTKYLEQSKEIKQNLTGTENFDNCFCVIFDCYYKSFISAKKTGH